MTTIQNQRSAWSTRTRRLYLVLGLLAALAGGAVHVGAQVASFYNPRAQFFDNTGAVLNGGKLCTYVAGTTTPQTTYSDVGLSSPNANPIILDSAGRLQTNVYLSAAAYKFVLLTAGTDATCNTGTTIWTSDQIQPTSLLSASNLTTGTIPIARLTNGTTTYINPTTTGAVNNWAPGLSGNTIIQWSGVADLTVTGIAGGVTGQLVTFINTGGATAYFTPNSASSLAANRLTNIIGSGNTPVATGGYITYQDNGSVWVLVGHDQGTSLPWTPILGGSTSEAGQAYSQQTGRYYVHGRQVHVDASIVLSTLGTITGNVRIKQLPFTVAAGNTAAGTIGFWGNLTTAEVWLGMYFVGSTTTGDVTARATAGTTVTTLLQGDLSNTSNLIFSGDYQTN